MLSDFHCLRPYWLLALLPAVLIGWRLWAAASAAQPWRGIIDPKLLPSLLVGGEQRQRRFPLLLLLVGWLLTTVALAGPTWKRAPAPFADDAAVLVVVLKVTPSMLSEDVQPHRLARAVEKVQDLLALRPGARTALIAYAGSAHRVLPLTSDAGIVRTFAAELSPQVMPAEGDAVSAALRLADAQVRRSGQRGWTLLVCDAIAESESRGLAQYRSEGRTPVAVLAVAGEGPELASVRQGAATLGADLAPAAPDDSDVRRLAANTRFSAAAGEGDTHWQDAGYWLTPLIAVLALSWFRPGWVVSLEGRS